MQSTAMLEIRQSFGGPFPSEQAALQDKGGVLPSDQVLMPGRSVGPSSADGGQSWYLISRASAVTGRDLRAADQSRDENGQPAVSFTLTGEGGRRFASFTGAHVGDYLAVVLDNQVQEVAIHQRPDSRSGRIKGLSEQKPKICRMILRSGACRPASTTWRSARLGHRWAAIRSARESRPR